MEAIHCLKRSRKEQVASRPANKFSLRMKPVSEEQVTFFPILSSFIKIHLQAADLSGLQSCVVFVLFPVFISQAFPKWHVQPRL